MCEIDDTLLLSPYSHSNDYIISNKDDILIKESFFEFLSCVNGRIWLYFDVPTPRCYYTCSLIFYLVSIHNDTSGYTSVILPARNTARIGRPYPINNNKNNKAISCRQHGQNSVGKFQLEYSFASIIQKDTYLCVISSFFLENTRFIIAKRLLMLSV